MEGSKIYGLCLERLKYQIDNARVRFGGALSRQAEPVLLESYNTGDREDIIDILELYDIEERTPERLNEKLEELSYSASVLLRETLSFDYTDEGHLGLYLALQTESDGFIEENVCDSLAAANHQ
jgi:hypothetical protein